MTEPEHESCNIKNLNNIYITYKEKHQYITPQNSMLKMSAATAKISGRIRKRSWPGHCPILLIKLDRI